MAINGISEPLANGLIGCIDWLSFTFSSNSGLSPSDVIEFLGFHSNDFLSMSKGANGYRSMYILNGHNIRILHDGNADMGIHVDVSGSAIIELIHSWQHKKTVIVPFDNTVVEEIENTVLLDLLSTLSKIATFTRLDLAIDDIGCNYYSCDDVIHLIENQQLISKFRGYDNKVPRSINDGEKLGHTIYLGSSKSDIKLRIYDKRLEQLFKHKIECSYEWVRWEVELKQERANQTVRLLLDCKQLSVVCIGILCNYLRFINKDNNNKSRCSNELTWDRFISDMERMKLYVPSAPKSIEDTKKWINDSVGASLSAVIEYDGGSLDFIYNNLDKWQNKRRNNRELTSRLNRSK